MGGGGELHMLVKFRIKKCGNLEVSLNTNFLPNNNNVIS